MVPSVFKEKNKLELEEIKVKGISGIEHYIKVVKDGDSVFLYAELDEPRIEDIISILAIAVDTKLKPYFVVKSGNIPEEWISEIKKFGGKITYSLAN